MIGAKIKGIAVAGLLAISLLLTSCDPSSSSLPEDFDRSGEEMRITVIFHPSQQAVDEAYVKEFGRARNERGINRLGFAVWANPGNKPYWCRIHAQKPTRVSGDQKMETLGHELTHCLIGTFHPEVK